MPAHETLQLHVPEPEVRPGGKPDFSKVEIPKAGSVPRPPVDVDPRDIRDLAFSIIRVLNRQGEAVGPWAGTLTTAELLEGLRHMMTLRTFDARMQMAQRQGKTSFYMQHIGEEAVSCAFRRALEPGDMNFPTYRQAGLLIAGGYPMVEMMNQIYSNEADPLKGRQLPVMYSLEGARLLLDLRQSGDAVYPGGRLGDGVGDQRRHQDRRGLDRRRLDRRKRFPCGAGLCLDLPGAGGPQHRQQPVGDLDLPGHRPRRIGHLRGARPRLRHSGAAGRRQRLSRGPCGRQMGGRAGAPQSRARRSSNTSPTASARIRPPTIPSAYRPKTESDAWPLGDPVIRLKNHLITRGVWSEERHKQAEAEILDTVIAAQKEAESHGTLHAGGKPSVRDMFEGVYEEMPPHLRRQRQQAGV